MVQNTGVSPGGTMIFNGTEQGRPLSLQYFQIDTFGASDDDGKDKIEFGDAPVAEMALPRAVSQRQVTRATQNRLMAQAERLFHSRVAMAA